MSGQCVGALKVTYSVHGFENKTIQGPENMQACRIHLSN